MSQIQRSGRAALDTPTDNVGLSSKFMPTGSFALASPVSFATTAAQTATMYLTEAGDTTSIDVNDLHQGQIDDCFLISAIGELALFHPASISNMIKFNADGTQTVTLYTAANGQLPSYGTTAYKSVAITVTDIFPTYSVNNAAGQDVVGTQKEIWAQVLEKAVAAMYGAYNEMASGGNPMIAMEELTGKTATYLSPASVSAATLTSLSKAGNLIVFDTASGSSLPYNLVGSHAYMFETMTTVDGVVMVQLGNPWGFNQPASIPLSQLSQVFVEIDIGKVDPSNDVPPNGGILEFADQPLVTSGTILMDVAPAGGPNYLQGQYIYNGSDNMAFSTQVPNVFIHSGSGNDAIQVTSGRNVLDGGLGSNFLSGGSGNDTFFTDARNSGVVWNTIRNFHAGDAATLWGFAQGVSDWHWESNVVGAPGSEGATLRANIVGGSGRTGDGIDASITFTGMSIEQASKLQIVTGFEAAGSLLYIYNPGV